MIYVSEMHEFEVKFWAHHYATTSCLAHAQCGTIRMNTVFHVLVSRARIHDYGVHVMVSHDVGLLRNFTRSKADGNPGSSATKWDNIWTP